MRRVLANARELIFTLVVCLLIYSIAMLSVNTIFIDDRIVASSKDVFAETFIELLNLKDNPFVSPLIIEDILNNGETKVDESKEDSKQKDKSGNEDEIVKMVAKAIYPILWFAKDGGRIKDEDRCKSVSENYGYMYVYFLKNWSKLNKGYKLSHEAIAGVFGNIYCEGGGSAFWLENAKKQKFIEILGKYSIDTYEDYFKLCDAKINDTGKYSKIGNGLVGFTSNFYFKELKQEALKAMKEAGKTEKDKILEKEIIPGQVNVFVSRIPGNTETMSEAFKKNLYYDFPSSYETNGKPKDGTPVQYQVCDYIAYAFERNYFCTDATVDENTNGKSPYLTGMARNNKGRRMETDKILKLIKDIPLSLSTNDTGVPSQDITPTSGKVYWIGDSRTQNLIAYNTSYLKNNSNPGMFTYYTGAGTVVDKTGKEIPIELVGSGGMGIHHFFAGDMAGKYSVKEMNGALREIVKSKNNTIIYWFGINTGAKEEDVERFYHLIDRTNKVIFLYVPVNGNVPTSNVEVNKMIKSVVKKHSSENISFINPWNDNGKLSDSDIYKDWRKKGYYAPGDNLHFSGEGSKYILQSTLDYLGLKLK